MTYLYACNFLYLLIKVVGFTFGAEGPVAYRVSCSMMVFCLAVPVMKVVASAIALYLHKSLSEVHRSVNQTYTVAAAWKSDLFALVNFSHTTHSLLCFVTMPAVSCCMYTQKWQLPYCMSLLWNAFVYAKKRTLGITFISTKINCTQCRESGTQVPQVRIGICSSPVTPMLCKNHSPAISSRAEPWWVVGKEHVQQQNDQIKPQHWWVFPFCFHLSAYKGYCTWSDFSLWQFHIIATPMK